MESNKNLRTYPGRTPGIRALRSPPGTPSPTGARCSSPPSSLRRTDISHPGPGTGHGRSTRCPLRSPLRIRRHTYPRRTPGIRALRSPPGTPWAHCSSAPSSLHRTDSSHPGPGICVFGQVFRFIVLLFLVPGVTCTTQSYRPFPLQSTSASHDTAHDTEYASSLHARHPGPP